MKAGIAQHLFMTILEQLNIKVEKSVTLTK